MNSLLELQLRITEESGVLCSVDTMLDRKTIKHRFETEGEAFLTITLASCVKDLYKALDQGYVSPNLFPSFKRLKGRETPIFMGGFFDMLFDSGTGGLLPVAHRPSNKEASVVRAMVQIMGLNGKLFELCNDRRTAAALERYVENDRKVAALNETRSDRLSAIGLTDVTSIRLAMHVLFGKVNSFANQMISAEDFMPKHGPGATADRLTGNGKWRQPLWSEELETVFPQGRWLSNSWLNYLEMVDADQIRDPGVAMPVKVITVPKTQKTPRIIAIEPTSMQYMQQAIRMVLEKSIQSDFFAEQMMGYEHQEPNQVLARKGSINGSLATLDLSDASDLVSYELVMSAFHDWPALQQALSVTRSTQARVDGFEDQIPLSKFASMGSALCFPVEAMMFSSMVLLGCRMVLNPEGTLAETKHLLEGKVRVYGDDIIIPNDCAQSVIEVLEAYGLKVNLDKSFWSGNFRESCGKEYWHGFDVTYVKLRHRLPSLQKSLNQDVPSTVHSVAFRNNLREKYYFDTVEWLDDVLGKRLKGVYPLVHRNSPALGRHHDFTYTVDSMDRNLQTPMVKAYVVSTESPSDKLDDYGALLKCLLNMNEVPSSDIKHLLRAGRPSSLRIKMKRVSPF